MATRQTGSGADAGGPGPPVGNPDAPDARRASKVHRLLVSGTETDGTFTVIETRAAQHATVFRHIHTLEDELVYVLEGTLCFERGGEQIVLRAADFLFLPRKVEHCYRVESLHAQWLTTISPSGLEGYIQEMDETQDSLVRFQDVERIVIVAARYGISITGPGVSAT